MNVITDIFNKENCTITQYSENVSYFSNGDRIKIKYINENEIILFIDMTGQNIPSSIEIEFTLKDKITGCLNLIISKLAKCSTFFINLYTNKDNRGQNVILNNKQSPINISLINSNKIIFKIAKNENENKCGYVKIKCV